MLAAPARRQTVSKRKGFEGVVQQTVGNAQYWYWYYIYANYLTLKSGTAREHFTRNDLASFFIYTHAPVSTLVP